MLRKAGAKVAWVGRTASMVFGLALVLALMFGIAATALAGTGVGATFNLGKANTVNQLSSLIGSASSAMLKIDNDGAGPALALQVESGKQPLTVNSERKVARLNADKVDGSNGPLWAGVNTNGTLSCSKGVDGNVKGPTGVYNISFNRDLSQCVYVATLTDSATGEISVRQDSVNLDLLHVDTFTSAGSAADKPFYLIVVC